MTCMSEIFLTSDFLANLNHHVQGDRLILDKKAGFKVNKQLKIIFKFNCN